MSEDTVGADPWRDLSVENHGVQVMFVAEQDALPQQVKEALENRGVRVIVTDGLARPEQREQARQNRQRHAQECAGEWRDFGQEPGTHLRLVRAGAARRELRTTEQQTVASLRNLQPSAVSVGGRTFNWKEVSGPSWLGIAELVRASHQGDGEHYRVADAALQQITQGKADSRKPSRFVRESLNLGELLDEAGMPILYTSGTNYDLYAGARITFPDQRWLRFPVRGTRRANAVMTAVDQTGSKIVRYRVTGKAWSFRLDTMEITIHPSRSLAEELVLAIAMSAPWLDSYFTVPSQGGG